MPGDPVGAALAFGTLRDLLTQMIVSSDNTATDTPLERLGGFGTLNAAGLR